MDKLARGLTMLLGFAFVSHPASGAVRETRQPTSKWVVDFDNARCVATRNYGTQSEPLYLGIKSPPLGDVLQLMVVRSGAGGEFAKQNFVEISLDGRMVLKRSALIAPNAKANQRMISVIIPASLGPALSTARLLRVKLSGGTDETLQLQDMPGLIKIMSNCVADLRKHWNIGSDSKSLIRQPGSEKLTGVFSWADYPEDSISKMQRGDVGVALLIDEKGSIADCTVTSTSESAALDAQTCAKIRERAHFAPAIGADGKPARYSYSGKVGWRIED